MCGHCMEGVVAGRRDRGAEQGTWVWSSACLIKAQLPPSTRSSRRSPRRWRRCPTILCRRRPTSHFPVALRGYDRIAVDAYVRQTSQLVAELQATRSPEAAVRRALERVGEQISGILQRAHDTAEQITAQSRSEAEDRLEAARQEAARITPRAEERVKDLDAETDRIWAERQQIVEDTRELAAAAHRPDRVGRRPVPAADETPRRAAPEACSSLSADGREPGRGRGRRRGASSAEPARSRRTSRSTPRTSARASSPGRRAADDTEPTAIIDFNGRVGRAGRRRHPAALLSRCIPSR